MKTKQSKAFSMVDAIIILSATAIAIAVATPIITRKMVNVVDPGSSIIGGGHGRYEAFTKEIVKYGSIGPYEKAIDGNNNNVVVYVRQTDPEYKEITGKVASHGADGTKDTLYEEFSGASVRRNSNGEITHVTVAGAEHPVGGRYIVENAGIKYYNYNLSSQKRTGGELDLTKNRIIEGNYTKMYGTHPDRPNNNLWEIKATNKSHFKGEVQVEPWERLYSGSKVEFDRPICSTQNPNFVAKYGGNVAACRQNPIVSINLSEDIKNAVIHAVGGGGAGGGVDTTNSKGAISPKGLNPNPAPGSEDEKILNLMIKDLAEKF